MTRSRSTTRRTFLRSAARTSAITLGPGTLLRLGAHAQAASTDGYRALVCILLAGGADSFNMLVPVDDAYDEYAGVRADLALERSSLVPLSGTHQGGRRFGLHPALASLTGAFDAGDLAWITNIGSLVEPTSAAQVAAGTFREPLGLYSHADQIEQWQTAVADVRIGSGVGGRIADLLGTANPASPVSMNISTAGTNVFQSGASSREFSVDPGAGGAPTVAGFAMEDEGSEIFRPTLETILGQSRRNLLRRTYGDRFAQALAAGQSFNAALAAAPTPTTAFANDDFSQQLALVARVIAARTALGASRQTFFVTYGGWDHHDELLDNQARMLPPLAAGLTSFRDAMIELGVHDDVTTFTISDFGRTLTSNGRGSDHGWGGHQIVMGGGIRGGDLYGAFPDLGAGAPLDTGRGRFVPTTSVDSFYAELALWFGLAPSEIDAVVPNIGRFHDVTGPTAPIGFMT